MYIYYVSSIAANYMCLLLTIIVQVLWQTTHQDPKGSEFNSGFSIPDRC